MSRASRWRAAARLGVAMAISVAAGGARSNAQQSETPEARCNWEGWLPPATGRARSRSASPLDADQEASLRDATRSSSKVRRQEAALKLATAREPASVDALLALTRDPEPQVVDAAVRSLGRIGDHRATATLLPLVAAADEHVRQGAAWALGQMEDSSAIDALIAATRDANKHVRAEGTWALGLAGASSAVARLIELTRDPQEHVRLAAVCSLERSRAGTDGRARAAVGALQTDSVAIVREVASWAAARMTR